MVRRLLFILEHTQLCIFIPGENVRPSAVMLMRLRKRSRAIGGNSTKKAEDTHSPSMAHAFDSFSANYEEKSSLGALYRQHLLGSGSVCRHMQEEVIGTSAIASARASFALIICSSSCSPLLCRHSASPCSDHTLSGC